MDLARFQEGLELEWSPDLRQVLTLLVQSVPLTALRQFLRRLALEATGLEG